jgi:hypothetical protein
MDVFAIVAHVIIVVAVIVFCGAFAAHLYVFILFETEWVVKSFFVF